MNLLRQRRDDVRGKAPERVARHRGLLVDRDVGDLAALRARFIDDPAGRAYVQSTVPAGRLARPEEIGELIRYLASMKGNFLTGSIIDVSGGWPAGAPRPS